MHGFTQPVHSNCVHLVHAVPLSITSTSTLPSLPANATLPSAYDYRSTHTWVHPRADFHGTHNLLQQVARCRGIDIATAPNTRAQQPQPCLPELAAAHAPVAYCLQDVASIKTDLYLRGPVLTTVVLTPPFLHFWSGGLQDGKQRLFQDHAKHAKHAKHVVSVVVALLGWTADNHWVVALPFGATTDELLSYVLNGCCTLPVEALGVGVTAVGMLPALPPPASTSLTVQLVKTGVNFDSVATQKEGKKLGKPAVKARVILGHGANRPQHPVKGKPRLDQWKDKVAAGDIATIAVIGVTCAVAIIALCIFLSHKTKKPVNK